MNGTMVLVALILGIWQLVSFGFDSHVFPGLLEIGAALGVILSGGARYTFLGNVPVTIVRIVGSVVISMLVGVPLGIAIGVRDEIEDFTMLYLLVLLAVPVIIWSFLAIIWFGRSTYFLPLFAGVAALLPYVMINTWKGVEDVDKQLVEMATVFDASRRSIWRRVYLPHLKPYLFSTTRMVVSVAWRVMLIIEVFGTGSGLGYVLNGYFISQRNDMLVAWSLPVMVLVFGLERLLKRVEARSFEYRDQDEPDQVTVA